MTDSLSMAPKTLSNLRCMLNGHVIYIQYECQKKTSIHMPKTSTV